MPSDQRGVFTVPSGKTKLRGVDLLWPAAAALGLMEMSAGGVILPRRAAVRATTNQASLTIVSGYNRLTFTDHSTSPGFITDTSMHDVSTNNWKFIAPISGLYAVYAAHPITTFTTSTDIYICKNNPNVDVSTGEVLRAQWPITMAWLHGEVQLVAGDYLSYITYNYSASSTSTVAGYPFMPTLLMAWLQP